MLTADIARRKSGQPSPTGAAPQPPHAFKGGLSPQNSTTATDSIPEFPSLIAHIDTGETLRNPQIATLP